jgi:aspartyl-tRNA(Asn)/glutamyl-tRNA(Gln) amidotransferase subunit C
VTLSRDDVRHVAMLARLGLEPGEEDFYVQQLGAILAHIDRLREVDTEAIPPTAQVVPLANRMRDDEPQPGLSQEAAVANAPEARDGLFVVRAILEEAGP